MKEYSRDFLILSEEQIAYPGRYRGVDTQERWAMFLDRRLEPSVVTAKNEEINKDSLIKEGRTVKLDPKLIRWEHKTKEELDKLAYAESKRQENIRRRKLSKSK